MTSFPAGDAWYLPAEQYWVPAEHAEDYPLRQGDLVAPPAGADGKWFAGQLVHPTCELGKASVQEVQVVRVHRLDALLGEHQRARVTAGWQEIDQQIRPAFAHTFFLAPVVEASDFDVPMFSNLREVACCPREEVARGRRIAALSHDARVTFIRRKLYFRYRQLLPFDEVLRLEANRISNDPAFAGPQPDWAAR